MTCAIEHEDKTFDVETDAIISYPETPTAWLRFAHKLPGTLKWAHEKPSFDCLENSALNRRVEFFEIVKEPMTVFCREGQGH
jgi:hypothetical protein